MSSVGKDAKTGDQPISVEPRFIVKPPVTRQELLENTAYDPLAAEEFLEFLRQARRDSQARPDLT